MAASIVFIDSEHARIFKLDEKKTKKINVQKHEPRHHTAADLEKAHKPTPHFFDEVAYELRGMTEILVIGPGMAKKLFRAHLEDHHDKDLAKNVVGVETVDRITSNQILEVGRKFFKHYDMFH